jgi:hypothetical protein
MRVHPRSLDFYLREKATKPRAVVYRQARLPMPRQARAALLPRGSLIEPAAANIQKAFRRA